MGEEKGGNELDGGNNVVFMDSIEFDYIAVKLSHSCQESFCSSKSNVFTRCCKWK